MSTQETTLSNGLRVVTENRRSLQSLSIGVFAAAGARHERNTTSGLAHCLEHMVFKGTKSRSARDIAVQIERVGGHMNAYTTRDNTCFFARILAGDLDLAVEMLADLIQNPKLADEELANEKDVILQELGQAEDTPDDIIFDELQAVAFKGQALGRSILGSEDTVRSLTVQDLRSFMQAYYSPENLVISAVGRLDHDRVVAAVERWFGALKPSVRPALVDAQFVGGLWSEKRDLEQVHMALAFEGVSYHDIDYYTLQVYSTLLGGGTSSRLFQHIREKLGLAYSVYSFSSSHLDTGLFGIYAGTAPERLGECMTAIKRELEALAHNLDAEETEVARAQLKGGLVMGMESTSARMEQLGRQLLLFDRILDVDEMVNEIDAVTVPKVASIAARYADVERYALAVIGDGDFGALRF